MNRPNTTRKIVIGGLMIALSTVLSYVKIVQMPYGGTVTAGSMVPILLFAILFGLKDGILAGLVYGVVQFVVDGLVLHPLSIVLDYILGFGLMGLAGLCYTPSKNRKRAMLGGFIGAMARYVMSTLSGVLVWGAYAPEGMGVWKYSIIYNSSFMIPEIIISVVLIGLLYNKVFDALMR